MRAIDQIVNMNVLGRIDMDRFNRIIHANGDMEALVLSMVRQMKKDSIQIEELQEALEGFYRKGFEDGKAYGQNDVVVDQVAQDVDEAWLDALAEYNAEEKKKENGR